MRFIVIAAFAAIPLQWFLLAESPAGDIRVHQLAAVLLTVAVVAKYGLPWVERGVRGAQLFILLNIYMIVLWVALNIFNGLALSQPIKQTTFLAAYVAVTAFFFFAVRDDNIQMIDTLRFTAVASVTVLIAAFGYSMLSNGVNPLDVLQRAIETGDPDILQKELFRTSFAGFGYDPTQEAIGNLRHEVFGGLLFTMYVASWANARRPLPIGGKRNLFRASMVAGSLLLLISLSRSVLVAAAIWPLLSLFRALATGRVSARQQLAVVVGVIAVAVFAVTGFLSLMWTRFTEETESYNVRESLIGLAFDRIRENFWFGGIETTGTSSHNFILDMWQRGGVFVGLPAVFIFLFISLLWLQQLLLVRTVSDDRFILVAALALPCVRLVTQGGGSLQIVEWVTLAFVMGILAATREAPTESPVGQQGTEPAADSLHKGTGLPPTEAAAMLRPTEALTLTQLREKQRLQRVQR